jgi:hypothetical protein
MLVIIKSGLVHEYCLSLVHSLHSTSKGVWYTGLDVVNGMAQSFLVCGEAVQEVNYQLGGIVYNTVSFEVFTNISV